MDSNANGGAPSLPTLDSEFSSNQVSMALTRCGLLVDKAESIARLYAQHQDWTVVEEEWLNQRVDGRSTRDSAKGIYRELSARFKTASGYLPRVTRLPSIFDQCKTTRDKAQILYLYLIEHDPLVKYTVHNYVNGLQTAGVENLNFRQERIDSVLGEFHYSDGSTLDYADSTIRRWGEGFRALMREIGVLETQQEFNGQVPKVGLTPLLVASGYSWETEDKDWLSQPVGWMYLFQHERYWESLAERLSEHPSWEASGIHGELRLQPTGDTYDWADSVGNDL